MPIRAIAAVTAGVAFLGAGTIFRASGAVRGLTTGAGLWLAGAIGMACATGQYIIAVVVAAQAVVALAILTRLSSWLGSDGSKKEPVE